MKKDGLCINPTVNLVQNIGFSEGANTKEYASFTRYSDFTPNELKTISHPKTLFHDTHADEILFETIIKKTDPRLMEKSPRSFNREFCSLTLRLLSRYLAWPKKK